MVVARRERAFLFVSMQRHLAEGSFGSPSLSLLFPVVSPVVPDVVPARRLSRRIARLGTLFGLRVLPQRAYPIGRVSSFQNAGFLFRKGKSADLSGCLLYSPSICFLTKWRKIVPVQKTFLRPESNCKIQIEFQKNDRICRI